MIDEKLVIDVPIDSFSMYHDFVWLQADVNKIINYLTSYLKNHNLENIEYIRFTHDHEIFSNSEYTKIPSENLERFYKFLDEIKIKAIIIRDNNIGKKDYFSKRILHNAIPFFLGGTALHSLQIQPRKFKKKFACLNFRNRSHKNQVVEFLYKSGISENTYLTHNFSVLDKPPITMEIDLEFDELQESQFGQSTYYPTRLNVESFCNIVTETFFNEFNTIFITEKIEKCFSAGQPFIVVSNPGFLKKLKELGFKTFSDWWDEDYDLIEDNEQRLQKIYSVIDKINKLSLEELEKMYKEMHYIFHHNKKLNKKWFTKNIKTILRYEL